MPWADLTDSRCYFELQGSGEPVLLIPGLGSTCRVWDPIVEQLAARFCVIAADNRGVGLSQAKRMPNSLRANSADLIQLLDHLQLDRVHVVGLSLGGVIAQRLASDHPERVNRLVLMSCTHRFTPYLKDMAQLIGQALRRFPWRMFLQTMELLGSGPLYLDKNPSRIDEKIKLQEELGISRKVLIRQLRCLAAADHSADIKRIAVPTLVVAGEYDALIPSCYARQTADAIPNSEFKLMSETGHDPLIECPDRVVRMLVEFLARPTQSRDGSHPGDQKIMDAA